MGLLEEFLMPVLELLRGVAAAVPWPLVGAVAVLILLIRSAAKRSRLAEERRVAMEEWRQALLALGRLRERVAEAVERQDYDELERLRGDAEKQLGVIRRLAYQVDEVDRRIGPDRKAGAPPRSQLPEIEETFRDLSARITMAEHARYHGRRFIEPYE